ncbi:hypothetical protein SAMN04488021_14619 [Paracoccus aminovorans]|uniref:Transposase n=1 Tax=Paracoccus aminovorans TaxID=34004 RepID=A0A1I3E9T6_9RHOB|nr:hypothetical protein JCM7685_pAMV3p0601 [Paracoccus aminovorans]SFH95750.1 hypothetical protein SAMN04488021_14619 [Paracoccus aminovorans]
MMPTPCALRNWSRSAPLPPIRKSSPAPPFSTSLAEMVEHGVTGLPVSSGDRPGQLCCADITCLPMRRGFLCLVAIMDRFTRKVLAWRNSNTLEAASASGR